MIIYGVVTSKNKVVNKVVYEANARLNGDDTSNPALVFVNGRIKIFNYGKGSLLLIFLIRNFLINFRWFKYLNNYAFKKALKKAGYVGVKPYFIDDATLFKYIKGLL